MLYGQPFVIQCAFQQKLSNWPKIHSKNAVVLREFSDFLNACQDVMPHVARLWILNDWEENQKLVKKLPYWAASRCNWQDTQTLRDNKDFPDFKAFAAFVSLEAEIGSEKRKVKLMSSTLRPSWGLKGQRSQRKLPNLPVHFVKILSISSMIVPNWWPRH